MSDTLDLWGTAHDLPIASIDWGEVPPRSSSDIQFRVKNRSNLYTAKNVVVGLADVTAGAAAQHLLSLDGRNFAATVDVGDLPASALSVVVTLRRTTASSVSTGAATCNLTVQAASWATANAL